MHISFTCEYFKCSISYTQYHYTVYTVQVMLPLVVAVLILVNTESHHPTGPLVGSDDKGDG